MITSFPQTLEEIKELYSKPLIELVSRACRVHSEYHTINKVQVCTLISYKTGGCTENCKYCAQSSYYKTSTKAEPLLTKQQMLAKAKHAKENGSSRVCLGAAWKGVKEGKAFDTLLETVSEIRALGVEVCVTLGSITYEQALKLKQAGVHAYNHNLDTSKKHYPNIVSTHTYEDRLQTLDAAAKAGLSICCGGIIGLGETEQDRIELLFALSSRNPQPDSVPINLLAPIAGTPLEHAKIPSIWEMLKMVATARILMPKTMIRLSAGRLELSYVEQFLCFLAGANSIFAGEKLLTVPNPDFDRDKQMLSLFGLEPLEAFTLCEKKT